MTKLKHLALAFATLAAVVATSASASAADITVRGENRNTGNNSVNRNVVRIRNEHTVRTRNNTDIRNRFEIVANTGGNESNRNTRGGDVDSGDIEISIDVRN